MGFQSFKHHPDIKKLLLNQPRALRELVVIGISFSLLAGCSQGKSWDASLSEGRSALSNHDFVTAEKSFQTAIKIAESKYGANAGQTATCMTELAEMYLAQSEYRKSALIFKDLVPIYDKIAPDSPDDKRVREEYIKVKKKIKKYKLEPVEDEPVKTDGSPADGKDSQNVKDAKDSKDLKDSKDPKPSEKAAGKEEVKDTKASPAAPADAAKK